MERMGRQGRKVEVEEMVKEGKTRKMVVLKDTEEEYDKKDVHKKDNEGDTNHLV